MYRLRGSAILTLFKGSLKIKFTNNINRAVFYLDIKYNPFAENIFLKTDPCARLGYFYSYITGSFLTENSQIFSRGAITNIFRTEHQ